MQTITKEQASPESAVILAISVLRERVSSLSRTDQDDFYELLPYLLGGDQEEHESARAAVEEILGQEPGMVSRARLDSPPSALLQKWMNDVGRRLHKARKSAGLTQMELAEKSGIPQSYLSRLERGEHTPNAMTIEKIGRALNVPVAELDPDEE